MIVATNIQILIFTHDCVILPGFGGFVASSVSARIDYERGVLCPPSKNILFNSKLQTNDGILTSYVAKLKGITYSEAAALIDREIAEIKKQLRSGEMFRFEGVGVISQKRDGRLVFEPDTDVNFLSSSFGLTNIAFTRSNVNEHNYVVRRFVKYGIAATVALGLMFMGGFNMPDSDNINQSAMLGVNKQMVHVAYTADKKAAPISEIDDINRCREFIVTSMPEPKTIVAEDVVVEQVAPIADVSNNEARYHVIIGCFASQSNVDKMLNSLKHEGHNPSVRGTTKTGLTRVSIDSYASSREAESAVDKLKGGEYGGAWVLHE